MKKAGLSLALVIVSSFQVIAQEYDSDSVYYTRISRPEVVASHRKLTFMDTVKHGPFVSYYFQINSGASIGCSNCETGWESTFSLSTIHGITLGRKLRVGGGAGFDSYTLWRTTPLFGNLSYDLIGTKNTSALFVQAQYGGAPAWHTKTSQEYSLKEVHGGKYMAAQIGYRIKYHDLRISLIAGLKRQNVSTVYYEITPTPYNYTGPLLTVTNKREMQRFTVSLGIGWK